MLGELEVQVSNNSAKAARADWIYSLAGAPTRRVSGEKLGLAYGRESLLDRFGQKALLGEKGGQRMAEIAERAVLVGDLAQLQRLSDAVSLIERGQIRSVVALDAYMRRPYRKAAWNDMDARHAADAQELIKREGVLPFRSPQASLYAPITSAESYASTRPHRRSEETDGMQHDRQHDGALNQSSQLG